MKKSGSGKQCGTYIFLFTLDINSLKATALGSNMNGIVPIWPIATY